MISIALRNLFAEKTRFAIAVGGVAFSVMLILIILSLYQGWRVKATEYIRNIETDFWVTQAGSADITNSASFIPSQVGRQIEAMDGVVEVTPFVGKPINFQIKNKEVNAFIVGFDPKNPITGPKKVVEGTSTAFNDEIIIDRVLARNNKLSLGDYIEIFGKPFKIVGIAEGANMFLFQFSFINVDEAISLFNLNGFSNFYLVKVADSERIRLKGKIEEISGVDALEKAEFVDKNRRLIDEVFLPIITVLVFISVLVGTAVIGLTIYTATVEKSREFGVLKALGGSNFQIYRIIFEQALASGVLGYLVGVAATALFLTAVPHFVPVFVTHVRSIDLFGVFVLANFMSILASYIPIRRILKIDPAEVFRS